MSRFLRLSVSLMQSASLRESLASTTRGQSESRFHPKGFLLAVTKRDATSSLRPMDIASRKHKGRG